MDKESKLKQVSFDATVGMYASSLQFNWSVHGLDFRLYKRFRQCPFTR